MYILSALITTLFLFTLRGHALPIKPIPEDINSVSLVEAETYTYVVDGTAYTMKVVSFAGPGSTAPSDLVVANAASAIEMQAREAAGTTETELATEYTDTNSIQWDTVYTTDNGDYVSDIRPDHLYAITAHAYTLMAIISAMQPI